MPVITTEVRGSWFTSAQEKVSEILSQKISGLIPVTWEAEAGSP
jgi:hypothetical protein